VDLNPASIELFGFNPSELNDINARQVYGDPAEREQMAQAIAAQGFVQDYSLRLRRQDGTEFDALITSSPWQDGESSQSGYQGIVRDVTERLRLDAELEQHRFHLEELVQIRTAQAAAELRNASEPRMRFSTISRSSQPLTRLPKPSVRLRTYNQHWNMSLVRWQNSLQHRRFLSHCWIVNALRENTCRYIAARGCLIRVEEAHLILTERPFSDRWWIKTSSGDR